MIQKDKLDEIFEKQLNLQKKLGVISKFKKNKSMKQQYINQMILAIEEEAVEIMKETAYKNPRYVPFGWKKNQKFNIKNFKLEIVDLMHFLVNLAIVAGLSSNEFFKLYIKKNKINHVRKKNGY